MRSSQVDVHTTLTTFYHTHDLLFVYWGCGQIFHIQGGHTFPMFHALHKWVWLHTHNMNVATIAYLLKLLQEVYLHIVWFYSTCNAGLNDAVVHMQLHKACAGQHCALNSSSFRKILFYLVYCLLGNKRELHTLAIICDLPQGNQA